MPSERSTVPVCPYWNHGDLAGGVGCLYLKDLEQVDLTVLEEIVRRSWATVTDGTFGQRAAQS